MVKRAGYRNGFTGWLRAWTPLLLVGASVGALAGSEAERSHGARSGDAVEQASVLPIGAAAQSGLPTGSIAASVGRWNSLRQSDNLPFSAYAGFLLDHRGWPGEAAMRRAAERQIDQSGASAAEVVRFFSAYPPLTAAGRARQALALLATGRTAEAREAARAAWFAGVMGAPAEQQLLAAFPGAFSSADHDRRIDVLLGSGDTESAARMIGFASPSRRPLFETRLALQTRAPDAASRYAAFGSAGNDVALIADRAAWLRRSGNPAGARELMGRRRAGGTPPANPEKVMETMVALGRAAAEDRQWTLAYQIASQVDDLFPAGTVISQRSYGERDEYTNLTWLAGQAAMRLGRPADAVRMFELYGRAAQSQQTRAKGFFWASRAASAAGQASQANAMLELAASPDQFYGQLALERLGRPLPVPVADAPITAAERSAFAARPLAAAARYLGMVGDRSSQTLFIRAIAEQAQNDREREIAADFGRQIGRPDLGVWAAREARTRGSNFYSRAAFPSVPIPPAYTRNWALAHGIMRQESSFERTALSHAGARGLMQLMPATAAQTASRLGVPYAVGRLTEDPALNVLLGNQHLSLLMSEWGGNAVLVAAAYNAGSGNVRRWVRANGDPRTPSVNTLEWIEQIPFSETRNYVQRVLENAVVYDLIDPNSGGPRQNRLSYYLGERRPG
jgi:soluble lytic murein transglycosylase